MEFNKKIIGIVVLSMVLGVVLSKAVNVKKSIPPRVRSALSKIKHWTPPGPRNNKAVLELCYFEKKSDLKKVEKGKVKFEIFKKKTSQGKNSLKCVFPDGGGALSFYNSLPKNWEGYVSLNFDVYSQDDDVPLSLFIADHKNVSYGKRYNKEKIFLREGWNNVEIAIEDVRKKISIDKIRHLNLFLWKVSGEHILYFDNIRLQKQKVDKINNKGKIKISIYPKREKNKINPLLYGSNLCGKMESSYEIEDFVKNIGITCFRFPGGGSPGWNWQTGWADFSDKMKNMPLAKIDYLIDFCKTTNTKLIVQVNIESGTSEDAAAFVKYMNKEATFRVDYWELGNEPYGGWDKAYMSAKNYSKLIKEYSQSMKKVDPTIKIGAAWGGKYYDKDRWDKKIIEEAAEYIDFVSYHWYPNHINKSHKYKGRVHPTPEEVMANSEEIPRIIRRFNNLIKKYAPKRAGKIEMTFLEWDGAWDGPSSDPNPPYSQGIMQWSLANAIFYADCLGQFVENGVSVSAHYSFQECGFGLIRGWDANEGWGGKKWDQKTIRPKAFAIEMFSKYFGDIVVESEVDGSPYYNKDSDWWPDSYSGNVPYITCYSSKSKDKKKLSIVLINKHCEEDFDISISIDKSTKVKKSAKAWILTGTTIMAQNDGNPGRIKIKELEPIKVRNNFKYNLPEHSVVLLEIGLL